MVAKAIANDRGERNSSQSQYKEQKHQGQLGACPSWGVGKLMPDENSPDCRNHCASLSDSVRNGWADNMSVGCNETQHGSQAPNEAAQQAEPMKGVAPPEIVLFGERRASVEGSLHQKIIHRNIAQQSPQTAYKNERIWAESVQACE